MDILVLRNGETIAYTYTEVLQPRETIRHAKNFKIFYLR